MNKKIFFIILLGVIITVAGIFFLIGGGVHTEYRQPRLDISKGVAVQGKPTYFGLQYRCGMLFNSRTCDLPIIPLNYKEEVVSRYCEIEYAGINRYTIVCRLTENSSGLVPLVNPYLTGEELKSYGFNEFPKDSYPNSSVRIIPKI